MSWTLITGASSGIGAACGETLAKQNHKLWLVARREDRLKTLSEKLKAHGTEVIYSVLDLSKADDVAKFAQDHQTQLNDVTVLINNAGLAKGIGTLQTGRLSDWQQMIETNVMGLLRITQLVLPKMCERKKGHVVNIGSVAGRWPYPGGNVYSATKSAVHMLNQSMRLDVIGTGVRISEVSPGMAETEFSEVRLQDAARAKAIYAGMKPLSAQDIADTVAWCLTRPEHVNIQEVVIYPTDQAAPGHVHRRP